MQRSKQAYIEVNDSKHPLEPMEAPRPIRVSPFYPREVALGGAFLEAVGWERPQWFEANASLVEGRPIPSRSGWEARYWSPIVGAEHLVTRERVAIAGHLGDDHLDDLLGHTAQLLAHRGQDDRVQPNARLRLGGNHFVRCE